MRERRGNERADGGGEQGRRGSRGRGFGVGSSAGCCCCCCFRRRRRRRRSRFFCLFFRGELLGDAQVPPREPRGSLRHRSGSSVGVTAVAFASVPHFARQEPRHEERERRRRRPNWIRVLDLLGLLFVCFCLKEERVSQRSSSRRRRRLGLKRRKGACRRRWRNN